MKMRSVALVALLAGTMAIAQDWKLGVGVSYRTFDDVDFSGSDMYRNFDPVKLILRGGSALEYNTANLAAVVNDLPGGTGAINVVENVSFSTSYAGTDEGISDSDGWAPVLTGEYQLLVDERLSLCLVANFQYFTMDSGSTESLGVSNEATLNQYFVVMGSVSPLPTGDGVPYGGVESRGFVNNDFSMDLYQFDLGLKAAYSFDCSLDLFIAGGPTVAMADIDSSVEEFASYDAPGNPDNSIYSQSVSDGGMDVLFGLYASIGAQYWFDERIGVSLEGRYDYSLTNAETDLAELDLSGFSGLAKVLFRF